MPSGERHLRLELVLWPAFAAAYYWFDPDPVRLGSFALAYLIASLFLTPDLDLHKNGARRRWGPLGFLWVPYSKVFKHRGVSHHLLLGMVTRVGYLTLLAGTGLAGAYYAGMTLPPVQWAPNWPLISAVAAGLYLPNVLHVLYDHWDTGRKLRRSRRLASR